MPSRQWSGAFCIARTKPSSPDPLSRRRHRMMRACWPADFRRLVADHEYREIQHRREQHLAAAEARRRRVAELIDQHISDDSWRALMHGARLAAERGQKEFQLLRFPRQLCGDGGRAVNVGEPGWPATLRGEATEIYLRWEHDVKPHNFGLEARVLDFPGGMPDDIGLFLSWGSA